MPKTESDKTLPTITDRKIIAQSRFFKVEQVDLTFSNGATREFERMAGSGRGAVMILPLKDNETLLLIREYAAGTHSYQLGFPKGLIDPGETPEQAADRELQEEAGFTAKKLSRLRQVSMAPTFFNAHIHLIVAQGLSEKTLEGDEPEPLDVIEWPISKIDELLDREDFIEARCIAGLLLLERWLAKQG